MKLDYKRKMIQKKYRDRMQNKISKKHTIEAIIVATVIILMVVLNLIFKAF
ncbi:hypothetical protein ACFDTO_34405 [Microbacteriaceae bacterium 4G12]